MSVTIIETINNLDVTDDTIVTQKYEDSHEGWHSTGELEDEAVRETNTASAVAKPSDQPQALRRPSASA